MTVAGIAEFLCGAAFGVSVHYAIVEIRGWLAVRERLDDVRHFCALPKVRFEGNNALAKRCARAITEKAMGDVMSSLHGDETVN